MSPPSIYTIGTGARSLEDLVEALRSFGVTLLADVRSFPRSQRHPHFDGENLEAALPAEGIAYRWLGRELGGLRKAGYQAHRRTRLYEEGLEALVELARATPTAFCCAETSPAACHRRFIGWDLEARGWRVVHILAPGVSTTLPYSGDLFGS